MSEPVSEIRIADVVMFLTVIFSALANYYSMRERIKVMETKMAPISAWWNRMAERAANQVFGREADEGSDPR